ncbi:MAG: endonuclease III [Elusimicrobiota bacterium]
MGTEKINKIYNTLSTKYPKADISLNFRNNWQLLVATILSAQCTDKRVNKITKKLFRDYPRLENYLDMSKEELIRYIRPAGFYNNKAKNILGAAKLIDDKFNGKVPDNMEDMLKIPGVARKTANVVLGNAYGIFEGIAIDTHVKRLSYRLGLTKHKNPDKIEQDLMKILPRKKWFRFTYLLIEHGRNTCKARNPRCLDCPLQKICLQKGI